MLEYFFWVLIKAPTLETDYLFVRSLDDTLSRFRALLTKFSDDPAAVALDDSDLDTCAKVRPGAYRLTDRTYEKLRRNRKAWKRVLEELAVLRRSTLGGVSEPRP